MPVQFVCPQCSQMLSVGSRKIGTAVACPRCGQHVTVPDQEAGAASVAMKRAQKAAGGQEAPLSEFMVFDDIPSVVTEPPPIFNINVQPEKPAEPPLRPRSPDRSTASAPLWQKHRGEHGEPMLLLSRRTLFVQAGILGVATLSAFGLGYLMGYGVAPATTAGPAQQSGEGTVLQGFVRYRAAPGDVRGDSGAVVIALPDAKFPNPKIGVQGLRPGDPEPPAGKGVMLALELLGGATARVADDGSYTLPVPEPGRYFLFFISRNAQRTAGSQPDEFQLALMQRYFQPADELIGMQKYLWRVETLPAGPSSRTHDFGLSGVE